MERIIKQLNDKKSSTLNYLKHIHGYLSNMCFYNKHFFSGIEDLYEDFEFAALCEGKWGMRVLSDETQQMLKEFEEKWTEYRKRHPYSDDSFFNFCDPVWRKITREYLIPSLESLEKDFDFLEMDYQSFKEINKPNAKPSEEDILERGRTLYNLLLKHKIISKSYLAHKKR